MKGLLSNKKGTATVEAAVVFPVVFLAVVSVIYIMIVLYSETAENCEADYAALSEAGNCSENFQVEPASSAGYDSSKGGLVFRYAQVSGNYNIRLGGLLENSVKGTASSRAFYFNEAEAIRTYDFIGDFIKE